ncbi:hypothetical protein FQR65_LT01119 [Abscondita terminalis]|nr:hypothetical protein FQR65_LT01119 [Abscondita terminalis]
MHNLFQCHVLFHILLIAGVIGQNKTKIKDEDRPYEFSFKIGSEQHRYEKKDVNGIIQGEFGFITADGVYHVTVYATDENGNFKILSMKNIKVSEPLDQIDRNSQSKQSGYQQTTSPNSQSSVSLFGNYQTSGNQQTTPSPNNYASTFYQPSSVPQSKQSGYQQTISTRPPYSQTFGSSSGYQQTTPSLNNYQSSSVTSKYQSTTNYVTPRPFSGFTTGSTIRQGCGGCGIITTPLPPVKPFSNTVTSRPSNINLLPGHVTSKPSSINLFSGSVTNQPVTNFFSNTVTNKFQNTNVFSNKPSSVSLISNTNPPNTNVFSIREKPNLLPNTATSNPPNFNFGLSAVTSTKPFNTNLLSEITNKPINTIAKSNISPFSNTVAHTSPNPTITNKPFNTNLLPNSVTNTPPNTNVVVNTITEKPFSLLSGAISNISPFSNTVAHTSPNPTITNKPFNTDLLLNSVTNIPPNSNVVVSTITEKPSSLFSGTVTNISPFSNTARISLNPISTNTFSGSVTSNPQNVNSVSNIVTSNPHITNPFLSVVTSNLINPDIDVRVQNNVQPNSFGPNDKTSSTLPPQIFYTPNKLISDNKQSSISVNNKITTIKPITAITRQAKVLQQNIPRFESPQNQPSLINTPNYSLDKSSKAVVENGVIKVPGNDPIPIQDKYPNMVEGLPKGITKEDISELLYKFNYTVGFHGHYEKGWTNGTKIGGYFVNGRDGYSRVVTYVADEFGYRPKFSLIRLGLDSISTPKEETEKSFGLQNFEFVWYPLK